MNIAEVRDAGALRELRNEWNALLAQSSFRTLFLTHEWMEAWWQAYGGSRELRVLLARDNSGTLAGIAPLQRRMERRFGLNVPIFSFVGDGSGDSDYLDFIVRAGCENSVVPLFLDALAEEFESGAILLANGTLASSPAYEVLKRAGRADRMTWAEIDIPCSTVALPNNWEDYLKGLAPRFRTKVRSVLRTLQARDDVRFEICRSSEQLDEYLPALYDLHRRRWAKSAKPGVFGIPGKHAFYRAISEIMLARGELFLSGLRWRGRLLACQYGFTYDGSYLQLQEGYEPASEHWNPGAALRAWSIQQLIAAGVREYDFLAGVGRHKSDWGATVRMAKMAKLGRRNARGLLCCGVPQWIVAARQRVKRLLPPQAIAARDARQERRRVEAWERRHNAPSDAAGVPNWVRSAAAAAYFHSPAFRIAPVIRDQYRVRTSPFLRLERRSQPSLRILYFHRINDQNDPFRPSMPTSKFEEQIRLLSKHYKIVSLREAMHRLGEGGPAEPIVAVTFDDGYADNYTNALPILERYGVPATIFLTTGSLDSREPMWFETLAVSVKRSAGEFVDVELDVPCRLSLRSDADRLATNATIFSYLRTLRDDERQVVLAETLARLKPPKGDERSEMLTWDQVREMRSRRVDFGGHTVSHPFVSRLDSTQAEREIGDCKRRIEEELQAPVEYFAYPNGREPDFTAASKDIVARAGYRAALSTLWGVNFPDTDPMELRRGQPWEECLSLFAAKLDWYQLTDS